MKYLTHKIYLVFLLCLFLVKATYGQLYNWSNSPGFHTLENNQVKITGVIGQLENQTFQLNEFHITEGFLQPEIPKGTSSSIEVLHNDKATIIPNPNNGQFRFYTPSSKILRLEISNILGHFIKIVENDYLNPSFDYIEVFLKDLSNGIYFLYPTYADEKQNSGSYYKVIINN